MKKLIIFFAITILALASACKSDTENIILPTAEPTPAVTVTLAPTAELKTVSGTVYIINGSSDEIYGIYFSEKSDENIGQNIIGGSTLPEGEEIEFTFADITSDDLFVTVETADGSQCTSKNSINLANGLTLELQLFDSELEVLVN